MNRQKSDALWWERRDLEFQDNELTFAGRSLEALCRRYGTPLFVYRPERIRENLARLHNAFKKGGFENHYKIHYAMKANRFPPLLKFIRKTGLCGIDACSPNEVDLALKCGFKPSDISYTGTSLSEDDLRRLGRVKNLHINLDSVHSIRSWPRYSINNRIGIRINPALGIGRSGNDKLHYSGNSATKFGIYAEQLEQAREAAEKSGLKIVKIHFHTGCGYLNERLPVLDEILAKSMQFINKLPGIEAVNIGGGLGVPHTSEDKALDLDKWIGIIKKHFGNKSFKIETEPGDYIVKDAGVLLLTMNYQEIKDNCHFTFINAGFNIAPEPAVYSLPFEPVPVIRRDGDPTETVIAGNINEALDIWYRKIRLSPINPGDCIALINAGAYSSSMASNHCMRGKFREILLK